MIKTRWSCRWITSQRCSPSTPQFSSLSGPARNHQLLSGFFLVISIISPTYKQFHDRSRCHLELELHSDQFGFSVFTEEMNFEQTKGCDRDYYQFGRDFLVFTSHKGPKRCGKWDPARRVLRDDGSFLRLDYGKTPRSHRLNSNWTIIISIKQCHYNQGIRRRRRQRDGSLAGSSSK